VSAFASNECQIAYLDNQQPTPYPAISFLGTIARSVSNSLIYDSERTNKGWLAAEITTKRTSFDPKRTSPRRIKVYFSR